MLDLNLWDDKLVAGKFLFSDDGISVKLEADAITLSEYAHLHDKEEIDSNSEQSDSSDLLKRVHRP